MKKQTILLADDDKDILEFLKYNLEKEGYRVYTAKNGKRAVEKSKSVNPDLIVLDLMMPVMDGFEACKLIREEETLKDSLIVFLTAREEETAQIKGFNTGADDYIIKPIKPKLFLTKIKAILKRKAPQNELNDLKQIEYGKLFIDFKERIVKYDNEEIYLPKKEFKLLKLLVKEPGKVYTREEIYQMIWGNDIIVGDRTIDVHIRKLRKKLNENHIVTIKGVGYKFVI